MAHLGRIKVAVVYCPVCNEQVEKLNFWPGYVCTNTATGETFVSEHGLTPPDHWTYDEEKPAPWADTSVAEPCGHQLTKEQALELAAEMRRQLKEES